MVHRLASGMLFALIALTMLPAIAGTPPVTLQLNRNQRAELLKAREAVWRAWFANDRKALRRVLPDDTIGINNGEEKWEAPAAVLEGAAQFAADGGRLVRLEFPRTEIQYFGDVAVLYSMYTFETEVHGQHTVNSGRATEIF